MTALGLHSFTIIDESCGGNSLQTRKRHKNSSIYRMCVIMSTEMVERRTSEHLRSHKLEITPLQIKAPKDLTILRYVSKQGLRKTKKDSAALHKENSFGDDENDKVGDLLMILLWCV